MFLKDFKNSAEAFEKPGSFELDPKNIPSGFFSHSETSELFAGRCVCLKNLCDKINFIEVNRKGFETGSPF